MDYQKFRQAKAIEKKNKERLLKLNPKLNEDSGIYFLMREDENGFRYAYIGQAVHILTRLSQHLVGFQHIDLSLKKHGLFDEEKNPFGWKVNFMLYKDTELDEAEQHWIKRYANAGYQLRNKTSGSQGEGKVQINDYRPQKGYREGVEYGKKSLARELNHIAEKHLEIKVKPEKANNKVSIKQYEKFMELIGANERMEE